MMPTGIDFTIKMAARDLQKPVDDLREQAPFAVSRGLTWLARDARDDVRTGMDRHFRVRRPWVRRGVEFQRAEKKDWPLSRAVVGVRDDRAKFLEKQLTTGTKSPPSGQKRWAVPARALQGKALRKGDSRWPGGLIRRKNAIWLDLDTPARTALATLRGRGKNRTAVIQWFLPKTIQIKRAWPFHEDVEASVAKNWNRTMIKSFDQAMKTAKAKRK